MGRIVADRPCPNAKCVMFGKTGKGNVVLHGFLKLKRATLFSLLAPLVRVRWRRQKLSQHFVAA